MVKVHEIKTLTPYYEAVGEGIKTAEVRRNDRKYERGDWLILEEWTGTEYTGRSLVRRITAVYELDAMGLEGYVLICMA